MPLVACFRDVAQWFGLKFGGTGLISKFDASGQGFFLKANSSLGGPNDPIVLPALIDREIHHECELAIIIGKGGRSISPERALDYVFGYSCLVDVVVRGKKDDAQVIRFVLPDGPLSHDSR